MLNKNDPNAGEAQRPSEHLSEDELLPQKNKITRRQFLKVSGAAATLIGAGFVLQACEPASLNVPYAPPAQLEYDAIPDAPMEPLPAGYDFFTSQEAKIVEAITSRIFPGTPDDPGALEAGVPFYIDKILSWYKGKVQYTYTEGPFAKTYEGDQPPGPDTEHIVYVKKAEISRYGFQDSIDLKEIYHNGLKQVEDYAKQKFGASFAYLTTEQQDTILKEMQFGKTKFEKPSDKEFFNILHEHTVEGMFADPSYGGNRDMVGWKLVGYPGAQRAYTPADLHDEGPGRPPQDIMMLHSFHPGQKANPNVIVPPSGSEELPQPNK